MERNQGPYGFDNPERPCALKEAIDRSEDTGAGEGKNEPAIAMLQRIEQEHERDGAEAEEC